MSKTYISNVTRRNPQPRSKRLKAGATTSSSSTVVSLSAGTGASGNNTDHTHDNLADLNKIGTTDGYLMLTELDKESGSPQTNKVKAGWADGSNYANDAAHADNADEASHAETADSSTQWDGHGWQDWMDQPIRSFDAVRFQSVTCNDLHSVQTFVDGLLGSGYKLWSDDEGVTHLAIDKLTVRQTMKVMELLVEKIRSIGGALVVSASNGRIAQVTEQDNSFIIAFEQNNNFVAGDLIRCSVANGQTSKSYWVEVADVTSEGVVVDKSSFPSNVVPAEGDECVLMGNTLNPSRQNLVMISAAEDGQPRIDVLNGVHTTSLDGCLRARLGNLDGISDNWFAPNSQPHGDGLYSDNVYLKGKFLLENGDDVKTRFEATEGMIASMVEGLRQDVLQEKGYLNNATFGSGMDKWKTSNEAVFYMLGNKWLWVNDKVLTKLGNCAVVVNDQGRTVVHIRNNYITQKNGNLRNTPDIQTLGNGMREPVAVYLSFYYRCATAGTLTVTFENVYTTGFETFTSMNVTKQIAVTEGYEQFTCSGLWNGTGDFKLSFTGDIYLYMLCLSLDKTEALAYRYRTLFEQTANLVKICAAVYDRDATALSETGLFIKPTGAGLYVQNADGSVSLIGVYDNGTIKLQASNIKLEGLVTAGGKFKILGDGSMEAKNGTFDGYLQTTFKETYESDATVASWALDYYMKDPISGLQETFSLPSSWWRLRDDLNIIVPPNEGIILPTDASYVGKRITLFADGMDNWTRLVGGDSVVVCENPILGCNEQYIFKDADGYNEPIRAIQWCGGVIELLGVPWRNSCRWSVVSMHYQCISLGILEN